jgi:4-diphosphocytidyl-2-C-methyl-D-erythritol kinase
MRVRACAKINRNLSVLGVRPDGFHELKTVFQSLALHDTLHFSTASEGFAVVCPTPGVPLDDRNLAWKAARLVWQAAGRRGEPVGRLRITKRIPAQGGLGGGSADGAAALVGWDRLWGTGLPTDRLRELAAVLGADVPFFLVGGTALGLNRGDELYPLADLPPRWVVLVVPPFGVSTPEAFSWWDEDHERPAASDFRLAAESRATTAKPHVARRESQSALACFNDLEASVGRRHPELLEIRRQLVQSGAEHAAMSGSGSTVFGLFAEATAARVAAAALAAPSGRWTLVTRTATRRQARLG